MKIDFEVTLRKSKALKHESNQQLIQDYILWELEGLRIGTEQKVEKVGVEELGDEIAITTAIEVEELKENVFDVVKIAVKGLREKAPMFDETLLKTKVTFDGEESYVQVYDHTLQFVKLTFVLFALSLVVFIGFEVSALFAEKTNSLFSTLHMISVAAAGISAGLFWLTMKYANSVEQN